MQDPRPCVIAYTLGLGHYILCLYWCFFTKNRSYGWMSVVKTGGYIRVRPR